MSLGSRYIQMKPPKLDQVRRHISTINKKKINQELKGFEAVRKGNLNSLLMECHIGPV